MASRMDRYKDEEIKSRVNSRTIKNKILYDTLNSNSDYSELSGNFKAPVIEVSMVDSVKPTRESYQRIREYKSFMSEENVDNRISNAAMKEEFDTPVEEKKSINEVLKIAKEQRSNSDEDERKRRLRNADYNILANLRPEEVSLLKRQKEEAKALELQELINTITSNSLRDDVNEIIEMTVTKTVIEEESDDGDLLSDLMPEDESETIISEELSKTILNKEEIKEEVQENFEEEIDNSFYSNSMELSKEDFEDDEDDFVESGNQVLGFLKIFGIILLLIAFAIGIYFFIKSR